jgi:hypothetical protein
VAVFAGEEIPVCWRAVAHSVSRLETLAHRVRPGLRRGDDYVDVQRLARLPAVSVAAARSASGRGQAWARPRSGKPRLRAGVRGRAGVRDRRDDGAATLVSPLRCAAA